MDHGAKGEELVAAAKKKLGGGGGFLSGIFGGGTKVEDAIDLFNQGANNFKIAKKWSAAGDAFKESAQLNVSRSKHEAASSYVEAASCYRKNNGKEAVNCLREAIQIYEEMGRFSIAAKHYATVGEIYEGDEDLDIELAMANYEKAADYYEGEDSKSSANKYMLKVAHYAALKETPEGFQKSIEIYEKVAANSIDNNLLKWSAREYYFKATLCYMCIDIQSGEARNKLASYQEAFPSFIGSRENTLLEGLLTAVDEESVDNFTALIQEYDNITRLDKWLTKILLLIKKSMNEEPDLC